MYNKTISHYVRNLYYKTKKSGQTLFIDNNVVATFLK